MIDETITELGAGQTHQSYVRPSSKGYCSIASRGEAGSEIWDISDTGLSLYKPCQGDQRENGDSGKFCCVHRQTTTLTDQAHQDVIWCAGFDDQQSGPYCAGRIFSKAGSCQKRRSKLSYPLPTTGCGSKSSLMPTTSSSPAGHQLFSLKRIVMN